MDYADCTRTTWFFLSRLIRRYERVKKYSTRVRTRYKKTNVVPVPGTVLPVVHTVFLPGISYQVQVKILKLYQVFTPTKTASSTVQ